MNWMRLKAQVQALGERADRKRLGQAGNAFEQHVSAGQEAEDEPIDELALPDDDAADLGVERLKLGAGGLYGVVLICEAIGHAFLVSGEW